MTATDKPLNFGNVYEQVKEIEAQAITFDTRTSVWRDGRIELSPLNDGKAAGDRIELPLTDSVLGELFRRLDYPVNRAFERLTPETRNHVLHDLIEHDQRQPFATRRLPDTLRLTLVDGRPVGLLPGDLYAASNAEFVGAVRKAADVAGFDLDGAQVKRSSIQPGDISIEATFGELTAEPQPGDVVHFGLSMRHSSAGLGASRVQFFAHRLVCSNGMTAPVCIAENGEQRRMRIRRGGHATVEKTLERIQASATQAFQTIQQRMAALEKLPRDKIDLKRLVQRVVADNRWSRVVRDELFAAIERGEHGGEETQFGVVNLLSYLGTHGAHTTGRRIPESVRQRLRLMAGVYAWRGVHTCPSCQQILTPSLN